MIGSALYLLILAPLGILVARLLPAGRGRNWAIAALSALVLAQYSGAFAIPTLGCVAFVYWAAKKSAAAPGSEGRAWHRAAVAAPIVYLVVIKLPWLRDAIPPDSVWITPLAVSYLAFQLLHFAVERRRRGLAQPVSADRFAAYNLFFPTLAAGPIKRYDFFAAQTDAKPAFDSGDFSAGLFRVALGFFKKLVVAQGALVALDGWRGAEASPLVAWGSAYLYYLYIYADFSGYTDIALGTARMMGYRVEENFRWPIFATNIQDFWRRWHITLTGFLRDYVYIPLGGSKAGLTRLVLATAATFGLIGLWHGIAWHFLAWGLFHAAALLMYRAIRNVLPSNEPSAMARLAGGLLTFHVVCVGWVLFDLPFDRALTVVAAMLALGS
ncbi:MBOAT family protein [bacterium]|nr:MBOAT family protein [bacterium]